MGVVTEEQREADMVADALKTIQQIGIVTERFVRRHAEDAVRFIEGVEGGRSEVQSESQEQS